MRILSAWFVAYVDNPDAEDKLLVNDKILMI